MNRILLGRVVVAMLLAGVAWSARAADVGYTQASGDWATDANWVGGAKPSDGDRAFIGGTQMGGMANAADVSVTTDESGVILGDVYLSTPTGAESKGVLRVQAGANLLSQGTLNVNSHGTNTLDVNFPGVASVVYQTDGLMEFGQIAVGGSNGGKGAYVLSGGTIHNHRIYIGHYAAGTLIQTSGQIVGYNDNNNWGNLEVGIGQPATYIQSGGSNELSELFVGGTYILSGGTNTLHGRYLVGISGPATVTQTGGEILGLTGTVIGHSQPTVYNHSGGSVLIKNGELWFGENSTLTYNLSGTATLQGSVGRTIFGVGSGIPTINQSGGTATLGDIYLGWGNTSIGTYNLSGGTLNARSLYVLTAGSALNLTGGTLSIDTVNTNLLNAGGALAPGQTNGIGKTQINGAYTASSIGATLSVQLGGTGQGTTYDWVSATGAIALNGNLTVALVGGFTPGGGDSFTVLTGSVVSGAFANAPVSGERYSLGGGSFVVTYNAGSVVISGYQAVGTQVDNDGGEAEVSTTNALIRGTLVAEAASPTSCGFNWWAEGAATTNVVDMGPRAVGETFTNALADLAPGTTYAYRTYGTNSVGEVQAAAIESFTTFGPPTIRNMAPVNVNLTTATARGQLTGINTGDVTVLWWEEGSATTNASAVGACLPNTPFAVNLSSLTPFRTYYYRCYATNAYGEGWADSATNFFTQSPTTDWRWSTKGGGDYNAGTNYNGGNQVYLPPAYGNAIYLGIDTYPAAQRNLQVTINAPAAGGTLMVGHSGTNNLLTINSGGSLNLSGELRVSEGAVNNNRVIQNDGLVQTHGPVYVALGGTASYALNAGELRSNGGSMHFGFNSRCTLTQAAGTTIDTCTTPGNPAGGGGEFRVGNGGTGTSTFNFNGGQVLVGGNCYLSVAAGTTPVVNQADATRLVVNGSLSVGHNGMGTWTQNGGTNTIAGECRVGGDGGGSGAYNLNAGVFTVNGGNAYLAISGATTGTFNQLSGTATFAGSLNIGWGGLGVYNLSNGVLRATTLNRGSVAGSGLNFAGGLLGVDTVNFSLTNTAGTLAVAGTNATGKTQVNGRYTVSSAAAGLQVQLGGTAQGSASGGYDWLSATETVTLDGDLAVALVNGFVPSSTDAFTIVTGSTVSGTFTNAPVSGARYRLGGGSAVVTYSSGAVTLSGVLPAGTHVANTGGATDVMGSSAKVRGSVLIDDSPPSTVKIYWWPTGGSTTNVVDMGVQAEGVVFTNQLSGLTPLTDYAYRCYVTNAGGEAWAPDAVYFKTGIADIPGGTEYRFQDGVDGYLGTQDTALPAGCGQGVWTPGYYADLWVGEDYFAANSAGDRIPPHENDDWRPRRSILRFDVTSLTNALTPGMRIARGTLQLTRTGGGGTFAGTPINLYLLPNTDGGWREGTTDWADTGAACWNWQGLNLRAWSAETEPLLATVMASSTDAVGTVYTFAFTNAAYLADWATNAVTNAGFRVVAPVIEYGDPGYLGVNFASSEHATVAWHPKLSVVLVSDQPIGLLLIVK